MTKSRIVLGSVTSDDDVFSLGDFIEMCIDGNFIDYDGFGYLAKDGQYYSGAIYPSDIVDGIVSADSIFTHVVWYNR